MNVINLDKDKYMNVADFATLHQITQTAVDGHIRAGMPAYRINGVCYLIPVDKASEWLKENRKKMMQDYKSVIPILEAAV